MKLKYHVDDIVYVIFSTFTYVLCPCCGEYKRDQEEVLKFSSGLITKIFPYHARYFIVPEEASERSFSEKNVFPTYKKAKEEYDRRNK